MRAVPTDRVRERWERRDAALGAWLTLEGPASAGAVAAAGFDWVSVDLQHGTATLDTLAPILAALEPTGVTPFVRAPWNDPAVMMRALDLGARGVICPMVDTGAEAGALVRACRYPPIGRRSYGPVRAAFGVGREQTERANEAVLVFAMIETAEGFANLAEIASTPGLNGLYVGPADLSLALGLGSFADLTAPDLLEALDTVLEAASRSGIVAGVHAPHPERALEMQARGFRFVGVASDADLLRDAAASALPRARPDRA